MKEFEEVVEACRFLLCNFHGAEPIRKYLDARVSKENQEKFKFGYFPNEENLTVLTSIVNEETLVKLKLLYERIINDFSNDSWDYLDEDDFENSGAHQEKPKFKVNIKNTKQIKKASTPILKNHNLVLPYRDVYGNTVALVGRTIELDYVEMGISKYKNTSFEKGHHLFGFYEAKESILRNDSVYLVEGQFDCIKAHEKNMTNVVALGSSSMTLYQLAILCRYTKNIYLLLDNDDAGVKGREKIIKKYSKYADFVNLYVPPQFKDLDEYLSNIIGSPSFITKTSNS